MCVTYVFVIFPMCTINTFVQIISMVREGNKEDNYTNFTKIDQW